MVFALLLLTAGVRATVIVPTEFKEIVADAALIVRGHITDVRAVEDRDRGVETIATISVDTILKGEPVDFVTMRLPGGVIGRYRYVMVGAPVVTVGQAGVFFLKRDASLNAWRPVGLGMGIYAVQAEPATGRPVVSPPLVTGQTAAAGVVVRGDRARRYMSEPEFESLVRVVMAGQTASAQRGQR